MVSDMGMKTKILSRRCRTVACLSLFCGVMLLLILEAGIVTGAFRVRAWAELYALLMAAVLLGLSLVGRFYLVRACREQGQNDDAFVNSDDLSVPYTPEYFWTEANRDVIEKYQRITDRKAVMELSIEATQYIALQQQVNPHFLYNTLDAIRCDMLVAGQDRIADTVEALSKYFSYVVSNMERLASIGEELGNVRDYFQVQEYRFEDRISMRVVNELAEWEVEDLLIPRLTLQPLVENAISHGIEQSLRQGVVTIRLTETKEQLIIHVMDDGAGMDLAALEKLNAELNSKHLNGVREPGRKRRGGIALRNVNSRIKLLFGEDYGLRAYSMQGAGTDIHIVLPKISRETSDEERLFANRGGQ